jgi:methylglutamate dehydrogenase subunit D
VSDFLSEIPPSKPLAPGRYGASPQAPSLRAERLGSFLATLTAGRGAASALSAAFEAALGIKLPGGPNVVLKGGLSLIGIGSGRWLACADTGDADWPDGLAKIAGPHGSLCDQSDGTAVFELSGARLREALAKLLNIDIDDTVFASGAVATTSAALIGVTLWRPGDAAVFRVTVARSYVPAFLRALASAAAEYGFELV